MILPVETAGGFAAPSNETQKKIDMSNIEHPHELGPISGSVLY